MPIPHSIKRHLCAQKLQYEVIGHSRTETLEQAAMASNVPTHKMARAIILEDEDGLVMVVLPVSHVLDFRALRQLLGRDGLDLANPVNFRDQFDDCEKGSYPPLGEIYGFDTVVVDKSVLMLDKVYFEPGCQSNMVRMPGDDFSQLFVDRAYAGEIAHTIDVLMSDAARIQYTPHQEIKRRVEQVYELPPMPEMATRILKLQQKSTATARDLASIVEMDPSLAAQVMRYASSPMYSYRGKINSIQQAISRVLGFDMVMKLAVGLAIGKSFRNPVEGPLGMEAFWRHASYCATLSQALAKALPEKHRVDPGMAYLAGLLHNFGFLLLGHMFQPEFYLLNKLAAANPKVPITQLEHRVLGMGHAQEVLDMGHGQIGAWLMQAWQLPEELVVTAREHHNVNYDGPQQQYVDLLIVANHLLKRHGIGDEHSGEVPEHVLQRLGISLEDAENIMTQLLEGCDDWNAIAEQMAA